MRLSYFIFDLFLIALVIITLYLAYQSGKEEGGEEKNVRRKKN